jgi:hypothetical protein
MSGALPKGRKAFQDYRPVTRSLRDQEVPLPEELSGDGTMLIWTAPREGAETSHRRHPGGDGDSVFTSRTSSPVKAYTGQSRDVSQEACWGVEKKSQRKESSRIPELSKGLQEGGREFMLTWLGESADSKEASELTEEDGETGSTLV